MKEIKIISLYPFSNKAQYSLHLYSPVTHNDNGDGPLMQRNPQKRKLSQ
jgi:hypothetical protein